MIEISLPHIYQLAEALEPLDELQYATTYFEAARAMFDAAKELRAFLTDSVLSESLRSSADQGYKLLYALEQILPEIKNNIDERLGHENVSAVAGAYRQFKIVLLAELGTLPTYFVLQKGGFDTLSLLNNAECLFPADLYRKAPEARYDLRQAGKALAYEMASACGFHTFRAVESVLRRYYSEATGGACQPKVRSISVYVQSLRQKSCGDERILSSLKQLADLHRNPLIHPEVALTVDEAISLLGMARSVVAAMLDAMPFAPPTITAPPELPASGLDRPFFR